MLATKALMLVGLLAMLSIATASDETTSVGTALEPSTHRALKNFGYGIDYPFFKFDHFPEFKIKFHKHKHDDCDDDECDEDKCEDDECDDDYKCDDECEDEKDEDEDSCEHKYVRRCRYKHNHEKCDCKEDKKKICILIKKKSHCH